jgi:hypothetical protein
MKLWVRAQGGKNHPDERIKSQHKQGEKEEIQNDMG